MTTVSLCLIEHITKMMGEGRYSSTILTSALVEGVWSDSRPGRFSPWEKNLWYPLNRRVGRPKSRTWDCDKNIFFANVENRTSAAQSVARDNTDWAIPAHTLNEGKPLNQEVPSMSGLNVYGFRIRIYWPYHGTIL
jgi:hypothetical protein